MYYLFISLIINAISLWVASFVLPGISFHTTIIGVFVVAMIFGIVNTLIKPVFQFVTCPFYILTLGLFTFIVNALMLMLTSWLSGGAFQVDGFLWGLLGSIIISIVSTFLSFFLVSNQDDEDE